MHTAVSANKMNAKNVRNQPSLRILWRCSPSRHLKQMTMESDESTSDTEETEEYRMYRTMKRTFKRTLAGLNNERGLLLRTKTRNFGKCLEKQITEASETETASLASNEQLSKISSQDGDKKEVDNVDSSFNNIGDVSRGTDIKNHKETEDRESPNAPKMSTDDASDETNSKLHDSDKASTSNTLVFFPVNNLSSVNKNYSIFTKIPHKTQKSDAISSSQDISESCSDKKSSKTDIPALSCQISDTNLPQICQDNAVISAISENIGPSSAGEACTFLSHETKDEECQYEAQIQEYPCKVGISDQQQNFERRETFANYRTGSSVTVNFDRTRPRVSNPRLKRPDVPKTFVDRGVQACKREYGKSPSRLENKVNILESRIRLEELRSRHWITRVISAEKSLLQLCEQLQTLDQAMKNLNSSHISLQERKSVSGLNNSSPQQDSPEVTSALNKNATEEEKLPVNNTSN